jgi:hypothetical protein
VMSLSASLQYKTNVLKGLSISNCVKLKNMVYRLCKMMLNQKLLHKSGELCKFASHVKVK